MAIHQIESLVLGLHPRCGEESPVQLVDSNAINKVFQYVKESILLAILEDDVPVLHEGDIMPTLHQLYLNHPKPFAQERIKAYLHGEQESFLDRPAHILLCSNCDAHCYLVGYREQVPMCQHCHAVETILGGISVRDIPLDIDIETYSWYSDCDEEEWDLFFPVLDESYYVYNEPGTSYNDVIYNSIYYLDYSDDEGDILTDS